MRIATTLAATAIAAVLSSVGGVLVSCGSSAEATPDGGAAPDASRPLDAAGDVAMRGDVGLSGDVELFGDVTLVGDGAPATGDPCDPARTGATTIGCEFFAYTPDTIAGGNCYAVFVANVWSQPISIDVSIGGSFDISGFARIPSGTGQSITYAPLPNGALPSGQVAILFLSGSPDATYSKCPDGVTPAVSSDSAVHGTGVTAAFSIKTTGPAVAYDIYPYGGGSSAITGSTLLIPRSRWGTNYVAVDPTDSGTSFVALVAGENGADVTIRPTAAIAGSATAGIAGSPAGTAHTYSLGAGQVLQFSQFDELAGSVIQSTNPVAVFGGSTCMNIAVAASMGTCDGAHQQIPPISALGHEYVAVRHRNRNVTSEAPPWRLVGAVDGTTLTYVPAAPAGAPSTLKLGQVADFSAGDPFVVQSQDDQHPFYLAGYMTSCEAYSPATDCRGDPEFVNVVPPQQYLTSYVFFTDPTYPETHLVVVRAKDSNGHFADVDLDCAGALSGWQPIGSYEWTRIDLVTGNFEGVGGCDNGRHEMKSDAPFAVTVWGWGSAATGGPSPTPGLYSQCVSYGYPAGAGLQAITPVVVPPVSQ
jgi:hypothetical protein